MSHREEQIKRVTLKGTSKSWMFRSSWQPQQTIRNLIMKTASTDIPTNHVSNRSAFIDTRIHGKQ